MSRVAIIAGQGALAPALAARIENPVVAGLAQFAPDLPHHSFRLERLVPLFDWLADQDVDRVIFAGAVRRPPLDPEMFDPRTASLVPRIVGAMRSGDDAALREVIALFEEFGFAVQGLHDVAPDMMPQGGVLTGQPSARDQADIARAAEICRTLGPLDIGQGAVVAGGLCLAVESLPGTRAMLAFVARNRAEPGMPKGGVLWKAPKPGQDLRIDLPAIGPDTVDQAAEAGLAGIALQAGQVAVLGREETLARAKKAGLFLCAQ